MQRSNGRAYALVVTMIVLGICSAQASIAATPEKGLGASLDAYQLQDLLTSDVSVKNGTLIQFPLAGGQVVTGRVTGLRPRNFSGSQFNMGEGSAIQASVVYGELLGATEGTFQLLDDLGVLRSLVEVVDSSTQMTTYRVATTGQASTVSSTTAPYSEVLCAHAHDSLGGESINCQDESNLSASE
ncbi:MAG: hypothetical protein AAF657_06220 [Acidobacteriota bacterium]